MLQAIGNFQTLEDGTVLFRKNREMPTVVLSGGQFAEVQRLRTMEFLAALLPGLAIPLFASKLLGDSVNSLWPYAAAYLIAYCGGNALMHRYVKQATMRILKQAPLAASNQGLEFPSSLDALRLVVSGLSDRQLFGFVLFFTVQTVVCALLFLSAFLNFSFPAIPPMHWLVKALVVPWAGLVFGGLSYFAIEEIWKRRSS